MGYISATCVLYRLKDANNWMIKKGKGSCTKDKWAMTCAHWGVPTPPPMPENSDSLTEPEKPALEASPSHAETNQPADEAPVSSPIPTQRGWECRKKMYCLKDPSKELERIALKRDDPWNPRWCQAKCEENPECAMVDIKSFVAGDWGKSMESCVLYKWQDANHWGIKDPKDGGCHKDKRWATCTHNGNALII